MTTQIDQLAEWTAFRCWVTTKELPQAVSDLVKEALKRGITPHFMLLTPETLRDGLEWQIILWGD